MQRVAYTSPIALYCTGDVWLCLRKGRTVAAHLDWQLPSTGDSFSYVFSYSGPTINSTDIVGVLEREPPIAIEKPNPFLESPAAQLTNEDIEKLRAPVPVVEQKEVEEKEEVDPLFTKWLESVPKLSTFDNDVHYIKEQAAEVDPVFNIWLASNPPVSTFKNDVPYLTEEDDPIFRKWLKKRPSVSEFINDVGYVIGAVDGEIDPIFTASPAYTISNADIANWNTPAGPETDPVFTAWLATPPPISTFVNDVPYLTAWGPETDPVFNAWLLTVNPANWNTAYSWGNHALAGYLTSVTPHPLLNTTHSDTVPGAVTKGDIIVGNVTPDWERLPANATATNKYLRSVSGGVPSWEVVAGTVSFGTSTQIPYMNVGGTDFLYSSNFKYDGSYLYTNDIKITNLTTTRIPYVSTGGLLVDTENFTYIGSAVIAKNNGPMQMTLSTASDTGSSYPYFRMDRSRGTIASPTDVVAGNVVGGVNFYGYKTGTSYAAASFAAFVDDVASTYVKGYLNFAVSDGTTGGANIDVFRAYYDRARFYKFIDIDTRGAAGAITGINEGLRLTYKNGTPYGAYISAKVDDVGNTETGRIEHVLPVGANAYWSIYTFAPATSLTEKVRINELGLSLPLDNYALYFGAGDDAALYYDGTNWIFKSNIVGTGYINFQNQLLIDDKLCFTQTDLNEYIDSLNDGYLDYRATTGHRFGDGTNQTQFNADGHQTMAGTAKPWEDLRIEPVARTSGTGAPNFEKYFDDAAGTSIGVFLYSFTDESVAGNEKQVFFTMQMPHEWDAGPISMHVHWTPKESENAVDVLWGLEYCWKDIGETYGDTTIVTASTTYMPDDANLVAGKHYIAEFADLTPGTTADGLSSILIGRLFRNSSAAADTCTKTAGLLYIDAHYQKNSLGSTDEYIK